MQRRAALVAVGALQLAAGVAGHVVAVRDRRAFDITPLRWRGRPERVARDALVYGTALSAPAWMRAATAQACLATALQRTIASERS